MSLRYKYLLVTKLHVYDPAVLFTAVEIFYIKGPVEDEDKEKITVKKEEKNDENVGLKRAISKIH